MLLLEMHEQGSTDTEWQALCAGWLNVLGQFATTGTLGYITVKHLGVMWMLANGHIFSNAETFLAYASELLRPQIAWRQFARPRRADAAC